MSKRKQDPEWQAKRLVESAVDNIVKKIGGHYKGKGSPFRKALVEALADKCEYLGIVAGPAPKKRSAKQILPPHFQAPSPAMWTEGSAAASFDDRLDVHGSEQP